MAYKCDENMKAKVEEVLIPIFGESIKEIIENYYEENNPSELLDLVRHMLKGYFGDKKAEEMLLKLNFSDSEKKTGGIV